MYFSLIVLDKLISAILSVPAVAAVRGIKSVPLVVLKEWLLFSGPKTTTQKYMQKYYEKI